MNSHQRRTLRRFFQRNPEEYNSFMERRLIRETGGFCIMEPRNIPLLSLVNIWIQDITNSARSRLAFASK